MIKIEKIEFHNYRKYVNQSITFDQHGKNNNLHVLIAENGIGKTSLLNGLLWCLYNKEFYLSDKDKAFKTINETVAHNSPDQSFKEVYVKLTITDGDKFVVFERKQLFKILIDPLNENHKNAQECGPSSLVIKITDSKQSNTRTIDDKNEADMVVKQYFDKDIYQYYFFDGDNLSEYFKPENRENIKDSIYNISQVKLLQNALKSLKNIHSDTSREYGKVNNIDYKIYDEIDKIQDEIENTTNNIRERKNELPKLKKEYEEIDQKLSSIKPIKETQEKRKELENRLNELTINYDNLKIEKKRFIKEYLTLLSFYPRIKKTLRMIDEKQKAGLLPPSIDRNQISRLIKDHSSNCPVCNNHLDEKAFEHLRKLLNDLEFSNKTSHHLTEIKPGLEQACIACEKYESYKIRIIDQEKYLREEINKIKNQLIEISNYLSQYKDIKDLDISIAELDMQRLSALDQIVNAKALIKNNEERIDILGKRLKDKINEKTIIENSITKKDNLYDRMKTLEKLIEKYEIVLNDITGEIKKEIEEKTWKCFDSMLWKRNSYSRILIDDAYNISLFSKLNNEMTGNISATETMALAYAFTFAIHEASGRNCPLVVDTPLSRVAGENRRNMARVLLDFSKNKQIIMLFTPDEYTPQVAETYDNIVATKRNIKLTDDESMVEEVSE